MWTRLLYLVLTMVKYDYTARGHCGQMRKEIGILRVKTHIVHDAYPVRHGVLVPVEQSQMS